jgi:hypothetical protein
VDERLPENDQNAINLASKATRALTISDWSHQDCEEFLEDLEKEFKKVSRALDTYCIFHRIASQR